VIFSPDVWLPSTILKSVPLTPPPATSVVTKLTTLPFSLAALLSVVMIRLTGWAAVRITCTVLSSG